MRAPFTAMSLAVAALASCGSTASAASGAAGHIDRVHVATGAVARSIATTTTVPVAGGEVAVTTFPSRSIVLKALRHEPADVPFISAARCPTGRVLVTAQREATVRATLERFRPLGAATPAAILIPGSPCRLQFTYRALRRMTEAELCNLTRHELGHARGLDHTATGLMAPTIGFLPEAGCEWADW